MSCIKVLSISCAGDCTTNSGMCDYFIGNCTNQSQLMLVDKTPAQVSIFNSAMQLISKFSLDSNVGHKHISVENISQGLYLFNIIQDGNVVSSGKFSVQH